MMVILWVDFDDWNVVGDFWTIWKIKGSFFAGNFQMPFIKFIVHKNMRKNDGKDESKIGHARKEIIMFSIHFKIGKSFLQISTYSKW
jgi:hypothetical protein